MVLFDAAAWAGPEFWRVLPDVHENTYVSLQIDRACHIADLRKDTGTWVSTSDPAWSGWSITCGEQPGPRSWKGGPLPDSFCVAYKSDLSGTDTLMTEDCEAVAGPDGLRVYRMSPGWDGWFWPDGTVLYDEIGRAGQFSVGPQVEQLRRPAADWFRPAPAGVDCAGGIGPPPASAPRGPVDVGGCTCAYGAVPWQVADSLATDVVAADLVRTPDGFTANVVLDWRHGPGPEQTRTIVLDDPYRGTACGFPDDGLGVLFLGPPTSDGHVPVSACTQHLDQDGPAWTLDPDLYPNALPTRFADGRPAPEQSPFLQVVAALNLQRLRLSRPDPFLDFLDRCTRAVGIPATPDRYRPLPVAPPTAPRAP